MEINIHYVTYFLSVLQKAFDTRIDCENRPKNKILPINALIFTYASIKNIAKILEHIFSRNTQF